MNEGVKLKGVIKMALFDAAGNIKQTVLVSNSVTSRGKQEISGLLLVDVSGTAFDYIAIGTGTGTAAISDTALGAQISRSAGAGTQVQTTTTADTAQLVATFGTTGNVAITEAGLFNASSTGVMLARQTFSAINMVSGDSLQITWKVAVS